MQDKILDFTPEEYKSWCLDGLKKDLDLLNLVQKSLGISAKALQVEKLILEHKPSFEPHGKYAIESHVNEVY